MSNNSSDSEFYQSIIESIEDIYDSINELFGEESSEDGLFSVRASTLHQFSILASAYHQLNTIDYLEHSEQMSSIFSEEIKTANYRTRDYEHRAIRQVKKNITQLEEYLDRIVELSEDMSDLMGQTNQIIESVKNNYYENILNGVIFYLEEINTRILKPAGAIIQAEITGASKLISTLDQRRSEDISTEAIARMCEVLSWGLETPPGWKSIQTDTNELTGDLEKKIGSLKAITTFYR